MGNELNKLVIGDHIPHKKIQLLETFKCDESKYDLD